MSQKESYYAALERQRAGEATIRDRFQRSTGVDGEGSQILESLYSEVGMKAFLAFNNCLEWLGQLGSGGGIGTERIEESVRRAVSASLDAVMRELAAFRERIERIEQNLAAVEAGMRRIDKFTLEAFRNLQEIDERIRRGPAPGLRSDDDFQGRGRLAKEDAARLALDAARRMREEGRRLTLASVAREAGLKYGQIVYAFGNKEGFLSALRELEEKEPAHGGETEAVAAGASAQFEDIATA